MFSFRNDPDADGVGVAFFDAVGPTGGQLDLSLETAADWRSPDWELAEAALGVPVFGARQVHGDRVLRVDATSLPEVIATEAADALLTSVRRIGLSVRAADCLPVLLADPAAGLVAAAHAGRVGLAAGVLSAAVEGLREAGADTLVTWIGPHICGACYEVPAALQEEFAADHPAAAAVTSWGTPALDLGAAAEQQLRELGCAVRRVDPCTRTTPSLHSYRREGAAAGRQAGVIWLP